MVDVCGNSDEPIINIQTKTKKLVSLQKRGINMYFYTNPLNNIYWPTDGDGMSSASLKQSLNCCLRGTNYILFFLWDEDITLCYVFQQFSFALQPRADILSWQYCKVQSNKS